MLDEQAARMPIEDGPSPTEAAQLAELRADVLRALGRPSASPASASWHAHFYLDYKLLSWLRARDTRKGVAKATEFMLAAMPLLDDGLALAQRAERDDFPAGFTARFDKTPFGLFGRDLRGASVLYVQVAKNSLGGVLGATSKEFMAANLWYQDLHYWDALYRESLEAGTWLRGHICVVDLKGFAFSSVLKERKVVECRPFPNLEPPFPDGVHLGIVRNVPSWAFGVFQTIKPLVPPRLLESIRIFRVGDEKGYLAELRKHVSPAQVPLAFGGTATAPWTIGGDHGVL